MESNIENTGEFYNYYFKDGGAGTCLYFAEEEGKIWERYGHKEQNPICLVTLMTGIQYLLQGSIYLKTRQPIQEMEIRKLYEICLAESVELPKEITDNINKLFEYHDEFMKGAIANSGSQDNELIETGYRFKVSDYMEICNALRTAYNKITTGR